MKENNTLEAAPVACAKQIKDQKAPKAKRIVVGTDVHLRGYQATRKKKAVVAIGRQLMVDLWRLQTGRASAQQLNLVMIGA